MALHKKETVFLFIPAPYKQVISLQQATMPSQIVSIFFEQEIEKLDNANRLFVIIKEFANIDLHPDKVDNRQMGYVFEELMQKFNEQANEEAGDHLYPA